MLKLLAPVPPLVTGIAASHLAPGLAKLLSNLALDLLELAISTTHLFQTLPQLLFLDVMAETPTCAQTNLLGQFLMIWHMVMLPLTSLVEARLHGVVLVMN